MEAAAWVKNDSAIQTKGEGLTPNWERICEGSMSYLEKFEANKGNLKPRN